VSGDPADVGWLVLWCGLFAAAVYFVLKRARDLQRITSLMNVVALALLGVLLVNAWTAGGLDLLKPRLREAAQRAGLLKTPTTGPYKVFLPLTARSEEREVEDVLTIFDSPLQEGAPATPSTAAQETLPDIYYIIPDTYIRADYLESAYAYDNSEFLSFLTDAGFYVADESQSNYAYTTLSLASSLNFMYLDQVAEFAGATPNSNPAIPLIHNNRLFRSLRDHGYAVVAFSSGFWFTELEEADVFLRPFAHSWRPTEFQSILIGTTPLSLVPILQRTTDDVRRERVLYIFDHFTQAIPLESPKFVFAHISLPHWPFIFGPHGEQIPSRSRVTDYTYDEYAAAYGNQVAFANERLRQVIAAILAQSPEPPVIIVQGDHGGCYGDGCVRTDVAQRMAILNAYYFPDQDYTALYEDITPVNTFRVVLDKYLGANYTLLPDRSYYSSSGSSYVFTDVTDQTTVNPE
jgi:hypothetical protein